MATEDEERRPGETIVLPETMAFRDEDVAAEVIEVGPPQFHEQEDVATAFADSGETPVRFETPFSDVIITPATYDEHHVLQVNDVRLRDLDLMVDCIFCCQIFGSSQSQPLENCPLCHGTGDVPKAVYFRMLDTFISTIAIEQDRLVEHPTVVQTGSMPIAVPPVGALADLRNALSISYLHSRYQLQFVCCDFVPEWRIYVRWKATKQRYYIWLQPHTAIGTRQMLAKIFRSDELDDVEYVLRYYILGGISPDETIWRPLL